jgi:leader peptidase (prepilin peptidase)/N-methyltransferase
MSTAGVLAVAVAALAGVLAGRLLDSLAVVAPRGSGGTPDGGVATLLRSRSLGAPWAELLGGLASAAVVLRFGATAQLPAWLWLAAVGLLLTSVDLRTMLLPNRVVLPGTAGGLLLLAVAAAVDGTWSSLGRAVLGGAVAFTALLVLALIAPSGMGMGDVKLAGLLGLYLGWLGWSAVLLGLLLGFVVQAVVGLFLLVSGRAGRGTELPFGPALIAGSLVAALLSGGLALVSG